MTPADRPARILIVDDEIHNRQLLNVILTAEGHDLASASSGEEALDAAARTPFDLILLDVMMPGLDGYQVAAKLKSDAATSRIPVILLTALDDRSSRIHGMSAGADDFLTKPVDRVELVEHVNRLLRLTA